MKTATIIVEGRQLEIDSEPIIVVSKGTYKFQEDQCIIEYSEGEKESDRVVENKIVAHNDKVVVNRRGAITSIMEFERQKKTTLDYETEFGVIQMTIATNKISITKVEDGFNIEVEYNIEVNEEIISNHILSIVGKIN